MHLLVRDVRSLDEDAPAQEPGQTPAPLVVLSFSDADLGALAAAWSPDRPELRLASLARLRHPLSTDLYLEQVAAQARCVVVRLLGGLDYWRYGVEELAALARQHGIALAFLPGDAADDTRLRALSTVAAADWDRLDACFRAGGPANMRLALAWAAHLAGLGPRPGGVVEQVPAYGLMPGRSEAPSPNPLPKGEGLSSPLPRGEGLAPKAAIILYRSHVLSADTAPIAALAAALAERGFEAQALYVDSLKAPATAAWVADTLRIMAPRVVLNATAFSARTDDASPLDAPGVPVLQVVLSGAGRPAWEASSRGLSATDLAMQVVLPELDGRLLTGAISFKAEQPAHPALQYARIVHQPDPDGVALAADRAAGWARLAAAAPAERRLAIVLSDYPGIGGQQGHAVGLDTFASLDGILALLAGAGYAVTRPCGLTDALCHAPPTSTLSVAAYRALFTTLPAEVQQAVTAAWGGPEEDPAVEAGHFTLRHHHAGQAVLALQPDRGSATDRRTGYHDLDLPPRHAYVAFHLWLRHGLGVHAMVQLGAHGSLEWLPGKAAALSAACHPRALLGGLPVVYPFIVNNPGEAAAAKRRLGAVTIGHLTPPIGTSAAHGPARELERLIDEYAAADGLDRRRGALLRTAILEQAGSSGLLRESGVAPDSPEDEALARLDAYLCDVKDLQLRDGLHVFGQAPPGRGAILAGTGPASTAALDASPAAERAALLAALDGRFVQPGPAGAPTRGRADVLPTGRNLTTIDPRHVPTRSAILLAERAAEALLRRHVQEHGEYPRSLVLDLWASASMRTGGEDLALAFVLLGARPVWDEGSARVSGFEVLPIALLDRPRIDVTLRISGMFRDAFAAQVAMFDALVRSVAAQDEAADWNPLAGDTTAARALIRVYGAPAGQYGAGDGSGAGWLEASAGAYGQGRDGAADPAGLAARVAAADAFIHAQDHAETDLLDSPETAAHEGGFAQAAAGLGAAPALYHLDTSRPEAPNARTVAEEVARVVRGRAANPAWIEGQMRHGFRGAAEIVRPLAALQAYAQTLPQRFDTQFDLLHAATLGTEEVDAFLRASNPAAHADLVSRFGAVRAAGLWHPRRNDL
ncbi:MAG: cobaltochelatase subunit CobN [Janthinobacterium lividum]